MLTSISPLGERVRGNRWATTVSFYVMGSALGGLTTGSLLGEAGSRLQVSPVVAAACCGGAAAADLLRRAPTVHRQVDEDWLTRYRGWVYGAGFGYQLGLGVVTIVTSAATYAMLALCVLSGSALRGAAVGGCFGLVRAAPLLLLGSATTPERLRTLASRHGRWATVSGHVTTAVLAVTAAALAVTA